MHPWLSNNGTAFVGSGGTAYKQAGETKLTSIKRTTDPGDDDLKSQEKAHAVQHGAALVVNAVDPDGVDHWENCHNLSNGCCKQTYRNMWPRGSRCIWAQKGKKLDTSEEN